MSDPVETPTPERVGMKVQAGLQQAASVDPAKWTEIVRDAMDLASKAKALWSAVSPIWPDLKPKVVDCWNAVVTLFTAIGTAVGFVKGLVESFRKA